MRYRNNVLGDEMSGTPSLFAKVRRKTLRLQTRDLSVVRKRRNK